MNRKQFVLSLLSPFIILFIGVRNRDKMVRVMGDNGVIIKPFRLLKCGDKFQIYGLDGSLYKNGFVSVATSDACKVGQHWSVGVESYT